NENPAFCYRITISNCGPVGLTNVAVVDNQFGDFTANFFPGGPNTVFQPGGTITYVFKAEVGKNLTNVVNTAGKSIITGEIATAQDSAAVKVIPANVACEKLYTIDGGPLTNNATLPDGTTHTIVWYVKVTNPSSQVNIEHGTIVDE